MIVADTSVIAYLLIQGDKTGLAQELYRADNDWILPAHWQTDFINLLSAYVRQGGAQPADSFQIWQTALALFGEKEQPADLSAALALSIEHNIRAGDALFLTLAKSAQTSLLTEDPGLLAAFPDTTRSIRDYLQAQQPAH